MDSTPWFSNRSESELRTIRAEILFEFEMERRRQNSGDPAYVYDEEREASTVLRV